MLDVPAVSGYAYDLSQIFFRIPIRWEISTIRKDLACEKTEKTLYLQLFILFLNLLTLLILSGLLMCT